MGTANQITVSSSHASQDIDLKRRRDIKYSKVKFEKRKRHCESQLIRIKKIIFTKLKRKIIPYDKTKSIQTWYSRM